jgi:hypothetical protein
VIPKKRRQPAGRVRAMGKRRRKRETARRGRRVFKQGSPGKRNAVQVDLP